MSKKPSSPQIDDTPATDPNVPVQAGSGVSLPPASNVITSALGETGQGVVSMAADTIAPDVVATHGIHSLDGDTDWQGASVGDNTMSPYPMDQPPPSDDPIGVLQLRMDALERQIEYLIGLFGWPRHANAPDESEPPNGD